MRDFYDVTGILFLTKEKLGYPPKLGLCSLTGEEGSSLINGFLGQVTCHTNARQRANEPN